MNLLAPSAAALALVAALTPGLATAQRPSGFSVSASAPSRAISPPSISGRWIFSRQSLGHGRAVSVTIKLWRSPRPGYGSTLIATSRGSISRTAQSATFRVRGRCVPFSRRRPPLVWFTTAEYTVRGGHGAIIGRYIATSRSSYHHCR